MNPLLNNKNGCYIAGGLVFESKIAALEHASKLKCNLRFYFHDHVWNKFDRNLLGKIPLTELYKQRALQIRNSYDYLILYYSGGSDSHNILRTFLDNKIPIDEVRVKWAKPLQDGKFYTPNINDRSAFNAVSEWNFAIKPELEKLKLSNPEIKINVIDYTDNITQFNESAKNFESYILDRKIYRGAFASFVTRLNSSLHETKKIKGKIVHIFGIEKPILTVNDKSIDLVFIDQFLENTIIPTTISNEFTELFYWSNEFPILPMEQGYQVALYFKTQKKLNDNNFENYDYILSGRVNPLKFENRFKKSNLDYIQKKILFANTWNTEKFQAAKPNNDLSDWYFWLYESKELDVLRNSYLHTVKNIFSTIDEKYLITSNDAKLLCPIKSSSFKLVDL